MLQDMGFKYWQPQDNSLSSKTSTPAPAPLSLQFNENQTFSLAVKWLGQTV